MGTCLGRTKSGKRCKKTAKWRFGFCAQHKWQPIVAAISVLTLVGLIAGLYQDLIRPVFGYFSGNDSDTAAESEVVELEPISINLTFSHSYPEECMLKPELEYYLVRSQSPASQVIVESGVARISVPERIATINRQIPLPPHKRFETDCLLPKSPILHKALETGGFELQLIVTTQYGEVRKTPEQKLFDRVSLSHGFDFHVRPAYKDELDPPEANKRMESND